MRELRATVVVVSVAATTNLLHPFPSFFHVICIRNSSINSRSAAAHEDAVEHSSQIALLGTRASPTRLRLLLQWNYLSYVLCCKGIFFLRFTSPSPSPVTTTLTTQDDVGDVQRLMRSATDGDRDKSESTSTAATKDREHSILTPRFFRYSPSYRPTRLRLVQLLLMLLSTFVQVLHNFGDEEANCLYALLQPMPPPLLSHLI